MSLMGTEKLIRHAGRPAFGKTHAPIPSTAKKIWADLPRGGSAQKFVEAAGVYVPASLNCNTQNDMDTPRRLYLVFVSTLCTHQGSLLVSEMQEG